MRVFSNPNPRHQGPLSANALVIREDLISKIMEARGSLTLLSAPAGFGKTTVMAQTFHALQESGVACAWFSANATDNDLPRFLNCLEKVSLVLDIAKPGSDAITSLIEGARPYALFIDELENIHERSVLSLIHEIVSHLPPGARIVISTRSTPALGLSSLRVAGKVVEIDASALRFNLPEARELFAEQLISGKLKCEDFHHLHQKTEGWAAALWLASVALKQAKSPVEFISQFSGSTGTVAEYLAEVVLADQPPHVRHFLQRISILKQFNTSLCRELSPDSDAEQMLSYLRNQSLIIPIESRRGTWRLHSLFADYLSNLLIGESPVLYADLHLAASRWFDHNDQPVQAIDHAVRSRRYGYAIEMLSKHVESLLQQGRMRLLSRWFASIPGDLVAAHPPLFMMSLWAVALTEGAYQASKKLDKIDWRNSFDSHVRNHGAALSSTLLGMMDRCEEAVMEGMDALENMDAGHHFASATLLNAIAHQILIIGQPRDAQRMIDAARRLHGGESLFNRMYSETTEGLIDMLHGRLRHASARFRLAVDVTHAVDEKHTHGNAWAGVLYTATTYESNDLQQTSHLINVYLPLAREVGIPDHLILIYLLKCRLAFIESDIDTALEAVTELEYLGHSRRLPRAVAAAQLERAKILLMQGNAAASQDELGRAEDPEIWGRECKLRLLAHDIHYLRLAKLRWEIHFGDPIAALHQIDGDLREARSSGRLHRALVLQLLRAMALQRCDNPPAAYRELEEALTFAAKEGYMRTILDEGPALGHLIAQFRAGYDSRPQQDPLLTEYLRKVIVGFGPLTHAYSWKAASSSQVADGLTRKEIEVLMLLTEGCSNVDLADRLHVSNSTVRTHLRNINSKLGTNSRTQALAAARRLSLLH
ncbi:helix-turn-helix transcriptional regulator [Pseudomonas putida]|nr:helix-turn-helix transcriptional regulator [Pseudomonas putida]